MEIRKVVIPAAGMGTRFLPLTKAVPKEMLPLLDRPLIEAVVEEAVASGAGTIVLVTAMGKEAVEDYFDIDRGLESFLAAGGKEEILGRVRSVSRMVDIASVRQKDPRGLGHAVLCARDLVGDEPFGVILPDDIIDAETPCLSQLIREYHRTGRPTIALMEVPDDEIFRYGVVKGRRTAERSFQVEGLVEKPAAGTAPSNLAVIGRYVLPPEIFGILDGQEPGAGGEIQLTDALDRMAAEGGITGVIFEGRRFDSGNPAGFLQANIHYALKDPAVAGPTLEFMRRVLDEAEDV